MCCYRAAGSIIRRSRVWLSVAFSHSRRFDADCPHLCNKLIFSVVAAAWDGRTIDLRRSSRTERRCQPFSAPSGPKPCRGPSRFGTCSSSISLHSVSGASTSGVGRPHSRRELPSRSAYKHIHPFATWTRPRRRHRHDGPSSALSTAKTSSSS